MDYHKNRESLQIMKQYQSFMKNTSLSYLFSELFLGFSMAVATFYIFPLSVEIAGVLTALFGAVLSVFLLLMIPLKIGERPHTWLLICLTGMMGYRFFRMPFSSYFRNGLYLGILSGILLSVQILYLSLEKKQRGYQKKWGIWYILGLVLGILLKS